MSDGGGVSYCGIERVFRRANNVSSEGPRKGSLFHGERYTLRSGMHPSTPTGLATFRISNHLQHTIARVYLADILRVLGANFEDPSQHLLLAI